VKLESKWVKILRNMPEPVSMKGKKGGKEKGKKLKEKDLKEKIYLGIPDRVRGEVWKLLSGSGALRTMNPEKYNVRSLFPIFTLTQS